MEIISSTEYHQIFKDPQTVILHYGEDPVLPKVLLKQNHTILKIFYPKNKLLTSDRLHPMALRFCQHSKILINRGYLVPAVHKIQYYQEMGIYLLHYSKIEGTAVQTLAHQGEYSLLNKIAAFMADLHHDGIFFRSINLENFLYTKQKEFALIDLSDMKFQSKPLSIYYRYRNLKRLFAARRDQVIWQKFSKQFFLTAYLQHTHLSSAGQNWLRYWLRHAVV